MAPRRAPVTRPRAAAGRARREAGARGARARKHQAECVTACGNGDGTHAYRVSV